MRIVHVVLTLNVGGQERLILNLSRELVRRGHEVSVISLTPGGALRGEFSGIPIHDVTRTNRASAAVVLRMAAKLRSLRPDVVHTHNQAPFVYAATTARLVGVRRVVHTKHGESGYAGRASLYARANVQLLSAFVAVSEETAEVARTREHVPPRVLRVIPNGIPLAQFAPDEVARARVRKEHGIPASAFVVGSVGRLVHEKNYPLLARAMAPLLGESTRLLLVGDGPTRADVEAAIPAGLARFVTLAGARSDVPAQLAAMDAFALSSDTEGLPLAVAEAMSCALPVVATRVGALASIVPDAVGALVNAGDERALSSELARLRDDATLRAKRASAARAFARERFSLERMTDAYLDLYRG
jgi:glycosyltransferase involved in cell wall biosynthesis